jgi:PAS domain S-box-containing protein
MGHEVESRSARSPWQNLTVNLLIAGIYYAAARLGLLLAFEETNASPVWPPSGIALAAILLGGRRVWPGISLGTFLANEQVFRANLLESDLVVAAVSAGIAIGNTLEAVIGGALVLRWAKTRNPFASVPTVFKFAASASLAGLLSASIGPTIIALAGFVPWQLYSTVWFTWWLGDVTSMMVVTPFLLAWSEGRHALRVHRSWIELACWAVALLVAAHLAFGSRLSVVHHRYPLSYLPFPFLLWAALRFGRTEMATAILAVSGIAVWGTLGGSGPFAHGSVHDSLMPLQVYVGIMAATFLATGALITDRRAMEGQIRQLNQDLEHRVTERTTQLEAANQELISEVGERRRTEDRVRKSEQLLTEAQRLARMGSWEWDIDADTVTWSDELYRIFGLEPQSLSITYEKFLQLVHPEDRAHVKRVVERAYKDHQPYMLEHRRILPEGSERVIQGYGQVAASDAGRAIRMHGTAQDITDRKRSEQERLGLVAKISTANERLQTLSRRLVDAQESERRRIARELHDGIGQAITAAQLNLRVLQRRPDAPSLGPLLEENITMLGEVLRDVRHLSLDLRPPLLDDLGLVAALEWYTQEQARRAGLEAVVQSDVEEGRIHPTLETAFFRLAQEAVTNVIRHARAKTLSVKLRQKGDELHLLVRDDGVGFDVEAMRQPGARVASLGLVGMEERATLIGGGIQFHSSPARGTEVHAWVSMNAFGSTAGDSAAAALPVAGA